MADIKQEFGSTSGTALTITTASLADTASRESTAVDNSTNKYLDAMLNAKITGLAGSVDPIYVYAYGSIASVSPVYTDGATGTDAAFTTANILNSRLVGVITPNGTTTVYAGPWSVAAAFGGILPAKWGIILRNESGAALSATEADCGFEYVGVYGTSV